MPGDFPTLFEPDNLPVDPTAIENARVIVSNQKTKIGLDLQKRMDAISSQVSQAQGQVFTAAALHLNDVADVIDNQKGKIALALAHHAGEVSTQALMAGAPLPSMIEPANALAPADQAAAAQAMYQAAGVNTSALAPAAPATEGADAGASGVSPASQAAPAAPADTSVYLIWSGYGTPIYSIPDTSNPPPGFQIMGGPYADATQAAIQVVGAAGPGYQGAYNGQAPVASTSSPGSPAPTPATAPSQAFVGVGPYTLWLMQGSSGYGGTPVLTAANGALPPIYAGGGPCPYVSVGVFPTPDAAVAWGAANATQYDWTHYNSTWYFVSAQLYQQGWSDNLALNIGGCNQTGSAPPPPPPPPTPIAPSPPPPAAPPPPTPPTTTPPKPCPCKDCPCPLDGPTFTAAIDKLVDAMAGKQLVISSDGTFTVRVSLDDYPDLADLVANLAQTIADSYTETEATDYETEGT